MSTSSETKIPLLLIAVLIVLSLAAVAFIHPDKAPKYSEIEVGLVLGSVFGQVSLAAGWCAMGPLDLMRRLPLSFAWLAMLGIALAFNLATDNNLGDDEFAALLGLVAAVTTQWLVAQLPLWMIVSRYGLSIRSRASLSETGIRQGHQFGIRELILLTTLVAVVLGIGRAALGQLGRGQMGGAVETFSLFVSFAVCSALISLPLIFAGLLRQHRLIGTCAALILAALVTCAEIPLFHRVTGSALNIWRNGLIIACMNTSQSALILSVAALLQAGGYQLVASGRASPSLKPEG